MKIHILQYLPENALIKLNKGILGKVFSDKSVSEWSKILKIPLKNMSRYVNGSRSISIITLNKILKKSKLGSSILQDQIEIKIGRTGKFLKINPKINIDERWVYVSELIKGDGHILPNFWNITFVNNNEGLINYVRDFFLSLGLEKSRMGLVKRNDADFLIIRNSLLAHLFNRIFLIPAGKKEEIRIPNFILKNKKYWAAAVRGAFDAEGSVTFTGSRRISITSNSKLWLEDLQKILNKLRIQSKIFSERDKKLHRLLIYHIINLRKFNELINPYHLKRSQKLKEIINNFDNTKSFKGKFHKKVLREIIKGKNKRKEISNSLNRKMNLIGNDLKWLKKRGFISYKAIYTNKGSYFIYNITEKGEKYLKEDLSSFLD